MNMFVYFDISLVVAFLEIYILAPNLFYFIYIQNISPIHIHMCVYVHNLRLKYEIVRKFLDRQPEALVKEICMYRPWEKFYNLLVTTLHLERKLSGRIDYLHWPRLIYWKRTARFEIDRPWNDFENTTASRIPFLHLRTLFVIRYLFLRFVERCSKIFIQPENRFS